MVAILGGLISILGGIVAVLLQSQVLATVMLTNAVVFSAWYIGDIMKK